jgi:streptogramin lyase
MPPMLTRCLSVLLTVCALFLLGCNDDETPTITSPLIATGTTGTVFSYQITASGKPVAFSAQNLPTGLSLNTSIGTITGTPTVAGTKEITLTATNYGGKSGSAILVLTVVEGTITPGIDTAILVGDGVVSSESEGANKRIVAFNDMVGTAWDIYEGPSGNQISFPYSVFVDRNSRIYHVDANKHRVVRVNNMDGGGFISFGSFGSGTGFFNNPTGIFVDKSDRIYIVDAGNSRIVRMNDMSGAGWTTLGSFGSGVGRFSTPVQVFVDAASRIYVSDSQNNRIVRCNDMAGNGWVTLGSAGAGELRFSSPVGLAVDPLFRIYVADTDNGRIIRMADMEGNNWTSFGTTGEGDNQFKKPRGLYVSRSGKIYVADAHNQRIVRISDMTGAGWTTFGNFGQGTNQFTNPCGVFVIESPYAVGMRWPLSTAPAQKKFAPLEVLAN